MHSVELLEAFSRGRKSIQLTFQPEQSLIFIIIKVEETKDQDRLSPLGRISLIRDEDQARSESILCKYYPNGLFQIHVEGVLSDDWPALWPDEKGPFTP